MTIYVTDEEVPLVTEMVKEVFKDREGCVCHLVYRKHVSMMYIVYLLEEHI